MNGSGESPSFVPRETPTWMFTFGDIALLATVAIWAVAGWGTRELLRGRAIFGVLAYVVWVPALWLIARDLHRRGRVRFSLSMTAAIVVVLLVASAAFAIG